MARAAAIGAPSLTPKRVLLVHNRYRTPGGEERMVASELALLTAAGLEVELFETSSDSIQGPLETVAAAIDLPEGRRSRSKFVSRLRSFRPEIVHVHNTFPLLSPSIFALAKAAGARTVFTAHNFRLFCSNGLMLRNGAACDLCLTESPWSSVRHACYKDSRLMSLAMWRMITTHLRRGTWKNKVDRFIALNPFARDVFARAGVPADRLHVVPNFTADPGPPVSPEQRSRTAVCIGRLSPEKGVQELLRAWTEAQPEGWNLRVAGSGIETERIAAEVARLHGLGYRIEFLGPLTSDQVQHELRHAGALIFPTLCFENFPLVVLEALAQGTPVLAPATGALPWILGDAARVITPSVAERFSAELRTHLQDLPSLQTAGSLGRKRYQDSYTAERHFRALQSVYNGDSHG